MLIVERKDMNDNHGRVDDAELLVESSEEDGLNSSKEKKMCMIVTNGRQDRNVNVKDITEDADEEERVRMIVNKREDDGPRITSLQQKVTKMQLTGTKNVDASNGR